MKRISVILFTVLLSTNSLNSYASDTNLITLSAVSIENVTVTTVDKIVLRLELNDPLNNGWSPRTGLVGSNYKTQVAYCPRANWTGIACSSGSRSITDISEIETREGSVVTFLAEGFLPAGDYVLWRIYLYEVAPEMDPHDYRRDRDFVLESGQFRTDIIVPNFSTADVFVSEYVEPIEEQQEVEIQQEVEESVPEQIPTLTPQPSSGSSNNKSVTVIATPAIQSNFMLPAIKGDQNWRPLKGIKGNFENWKVAKKNSLAGVPVRFTKTNGSMITFTTAGEAVSVRYLAGKKRGSFSIFVNGKFLERIDTNKKKKQSLVKTWNNLGEGKHYVDIVAELDNGQSLAISGVQKLKD